MVLEFGLSNQKLFKAQKNKPSDKTTLVQCMSLCCWPATIHTIVKCCEASALGAINVAERRFCGSYTNKKLLPLTASE